MAPVLVSADDEALFVPVMTGGALPDPRLLPSSPVTRFAPAPTGQLHLGHLVNVLYVWGIARVRLAVGRVAVERGEGRLVGRDAKPREVLEDRPLVLRP